MLSADATDLPHRIALVHEWFTPRSVGGAEQVVKAIDSLFFSKGFTPDLVALVDGESSIPDSWIHGRAVKTSFIQNLPFGKSHVQQYLPLLPLAIEQFDLHEYPLVISSSHLVAKGVLTSPEQFHVSYVHTPVRYAWDQMHAYLNGSLLARRGFGPFIRWQLHSLRQWDQLSSARPDLLLANSRFTARRIARFWKREAKIVHPPVEVERFKWDQLRDDFYLSVCRLVPYKRVDLLVKAFNRLGLPLLVVGDGPQRHLLEKIAGPTVKILGHQSSSAVDDLLSRCRAFVYSGIEDFGIAPVEAMAAGAPVIGLGKGGLLDTVRCVRACNSSPTGVLFPDQTVASIQEAVAWFHESRLWSQFTSESIRMWAEQFSVKSFELRFFNALIHAYAAHKSNCAVEVSDPAQLFGFRS